MQPWELGLTAGTAWEAPSAIQPLLLQVKEQGQAARTAAASRAYCRYYEKAPALEFYNNSHQLAVLFSWKGARLNKLWQTHRAMLLPLTQIPKQHIQAVRKCYRLATVKGEKRAAQVQPRKV